MADNKDTAGLIKPHRGRSLSGRKLISGERRPTRRKESKEQHAGS